MKLRLLSAAPGLGVCAMLLVASTPAAAQTAPSMPGWQAGPNAATGSTFSGSIDSPASGTPIPSSGSFNVTGWFVDPTAQGWAGADNVQVFLGQMGNGGTMLAQGAVAENRPDVGTALGNPYFTNSGFMAQVPAASLPAGPQTLDVYVHTPGKGWWYEPVTVNVGAPAAGAAMAPAATPASAAAPAMATAGGPPQVTIIDPSDNQTISTRSGDHTVSGTATEPGIGASDIDRVEVYLDGERDTGALLGTTTPASDGTWSVTFTPTHFASTHSNLYVYAHSKSTGKETEMIQGFNITDK